MGILLKRIILSVPPIYAYAGFRIYDNLAAGIAFNTPYGNSLKWPKNWLGANLIQDISLKAYVIQPTLSYKIMDGLSVGFGLQLAFGEVNLSRALLSVNEFQTVGKMIESAPLPIPDEQKETIVQLIKGTKVPPAYARLDGKAHVRVGFNVGVMYEPCEKVTIGFSYRSKIEMRSKGG